MKMWTDLIQSRFSGALNSEREKFARSAIKENIFIIFVCFFTKADRAVLENYF